MSGRRRFLRALLAAAFVAASGLATLPAAGAAPAPAPAAPAPAAPAPAPAAPAQSGGTDALSQVGSCIAAGGTGDVLLVMDTSGSLKTTDPEGKRVDAATYFVDRLASFADSSERTINIAVAGFDTGYHPDGAGWVTLTGSNAGAVKDTLEGYRDRNTGRDTDYWAAVSGSRQALLAKAAQDPKADHCAVWFWFSDGQYDIEQRDQGQAEAGELDGFKPYAPGNALTSSELTGQAMAAGEQDLCRPGGQADQTRSAEVTSIAIGYNNQPGTDFDLLKRVATSADCGRQPPRGAFYQADDVDGIFFAFDKFARPGQRPLEWEGVVCTDGQPCAAGTHTFVLDDSLNEATLLANSSPATARVLIDPPGATPAVELTPGDGDTTIPGARVSWTWETDGTVAATLVYAAKEGWVGPWSVQFIGRDAAQAKARTSVHLSGDLVPVVEAEPNSLRAGEKVPVTFGLKRSAGQPVDPAALASTIALKAELLVDGRDPVVIADGLTKADLAQPRQVDLTDVPPGQAKIRLSLQTTTAQTTDAAGQPVPGTRLQPKEATYTQTVLPPANYPVVAGKVNFGELEGEGSATGEVTFDGDGCVWLEGEPTTTTLPQEVSGVQITAEATSRENCVDSGSLPLTLTPASAGNGLASGEITVMAAPKNDPSAEPQPFTVDYQLEMKRPANNPVRIAVFVAILAAGVLLPLGGLYLIKLLTSKIGGDQLFVGHLTGPIGEGDSFLHHADAPSQPPSVPLHGTDRRSVALPGGGTLKAKIGALPTEGGYVLGRFAGPSVSGAGSGRKGRNARLPLNVQKNWVVALNPHDPHRGPVDVYYLVGQLQDLAQVHQDARANAAERVRALRTGLPDTGPPAPTPNDDFFGGQQQGGFGGQDQGFGQGGFGEGGFGQNPGGGFGQNPGGQNPGGQHPGQNPGGGFGQPGPGWGQNQPPQGGGGWG